MIAQIKDKNNNDHFDWIDVTAPTKEELESLARHYMIDDAALQNSRKTGLLPKAETLSNCESFILRSAVVDLPEDSDVLQEVTDRITIFYTESLVLTVHLNSIPLLEEIKNQHQSLTNSRELVSKIIAQSLKSFETLALQYFAEKLDKYEEAVFLHNHRKPFLRQLYYLKRQVDLTQIVLNMYKDIIDNIGSKKEYNRQYRTLKDLYTRVNSLLRNTTENTSQLLSIYFNIESNHTNEIMRTLTIISVFFMPLTFIVGIYGMNFNNIPELQYRYGYPVVMVSMLLLSLAIYAWFKKKRWL